MQTHVQHTLNLCFIYAEHIYFLHDFVLLSAENNTNLRSRLRGHAVHACWVPRILHPGELTGVRQPE